MFIYQSNSELRNELQKIYHDILWSQMRFLLPLFVCDNKHVCGLCLPVLCIDWWILSHTEGCVSYMCEYVHQPQTCFVCSQLHMYFSWCQAVFVHLEVQELEGGNMKRENEVQEKGAKCMYMYINNYMYMYITIYMYIVHVVVLCDQVSGVLLNFIATNHIYCQL